MSLISEDSLIHEKVSPELLEEATRYTVNVVDGLTQQTMSTFHAEVQVNNPFAFDVKRFLPNVEIMDLPRFYEVASQLILDAQEREGVIVKERVKLVQEYQPERFYSMGDEVITARVLKRAPANMSRDGTARPQRASSFEYERRMSLAPNKIITVESRPIDHKLEFTCWARTSTLANERALWLERLFIRHAWVFSSQGVDRFFWEDRGPDEVWKHEEQRLHRRPLRFFVRLREFEVYADPVIKQIDYKVSTV